MLDATWDRGWLGNVSGLVRAHPGSVTSCAAGMDETQQTRKRVVDRRRLCVPLREWAENVLSVWRLRDNDFCGQCSYAACWKGIKAGGTSGNLCRGLC